MQKRLFDNKLLNIIAIIIFSLALIVGLASCSSDKGDKVREKKKTEVTKEKTSPEGAVDESSADDESASETNDTSESEKKARDKEREKAKEKERAKAKEEREKKSKKDSNSSSSAHSKKKWVPAVYKTVTHPAVTRQQKYIDYYTCQCGDTFTTNADWQAHRPKP